MANEVKFEVTLEEKNAIDAIKKLTANINNFEKEAKDSFKGATSAFDVFKGSIAAIGVAKAFGVVTDAAKGLFNAIATEGVGAAVAQEQAVINLTGALNLAGKSARDSVPDFIAFADSLEKTTNIQDDLILNNIALLQSLAPLTDRGLKEATKAAIDLSKRFNVDLTTAFKAVGAAANGNISLLERLTKQQFQEGATRAVTFGKALQQLGKISKGAAEELAQGFDGLVTGAENSIGNFLESFGKIITENEAVKAVLKTISLLFQEFQSFVEANADAIDDFITTLVDGFVSAVKITIDSIKAVIRFFDEWGESIITAAKIVVAPIAAVVLLLGGLTVALNAAAIAGAAFSAAMAVVTSPIFIAVAAFTLLVVAIKIIRDNFNVIVGTLKVFAGNVLSVVAPAIQLLVEYFTLIPNTVAKIISSLKDITVFGKKVIPPDVVAAAEKFTSAIDGVSASVKNFGEKLKESGEAQKKISTENTAAVDAETKAFVDNQNKKKEALDDLGNAHLIAFQKQLTLNQLLQEALNEQNEQFKSVQNEKVAAEDAALLERLSANLGQQEALIALSNAKKLQDQGKFDEAKKVLRDADRKAQEKDLKLIADFESVQAKGRQSNFRDSLNTISSLQSESSSELFAIGKAAAIATATIDGILAVQKAWAIGGPLGAALAIPVAIATAANIARIASQQPPPKRQGGGILPGVFSPTDTTTFQGAPGELILNRRQQTNLFNAINQNQVGSGGSVNISFNDTVIDDDFRIQQIIERINDQTQFRNARLA